MKLKGTRRECSTVELTKDIPWEPCSTKFAEMDDVARAARLVMALWVTGPCSMASSTHSSKKEEENYPQHSPIPTEHCIAVASHLSQSQVENDSSC